MRKLLTLSALIVLLDQVTKVLVKGGDIFGLHIVGMQMYESHRVIGEVVRFTHIENAGMAFGWNFDTPVLLSLFSIAASIFLVFLLRRTESAGITGLRIAFALILGGAVGNLIDRSFYGIFYDYASLFHGHVVDFIDIDIPDMTILGTKLSRFYVFNVADAAVSIGVVLLLFFYPTKKQSQQQAAAIEPITPAAAIDEPAVVEAPATTHAPAAQLPPHADADSDSAASLPDEHRTAS